jgi:hypothetical protein
MLSGPNENTWPNGKIQNRRIGREFSDESSVVSTKMRWGMAWHAVQEQRCTQEGASGLTEVEGTPSWKLIVAMRELKTLILIVDASGALAHEGSCQSQQQAKEEILRLFDPSKIN